MNKPSDDKGQAANADSTRNSELNGALGAWQPIDTAPEKTEILGFWVLPTGEEVVRVVFGMRGFWSCCGDYYSHRKYPTHWMPVPPPPV